jgi:hypothetical protein
MKHIKDFQLNEDNDNSTLQLEEELKELWYKYMRKIGIEETCTIFRKFSIEGDNLRLKTKKRD